MAEIIDLTKTRVRKADEALERQGRNAWEERRPASLRTQHVEYSRDPRDEADVAAKKAAEAYGPEGPFWLRD